MSEDAWTVPWQLDVAVHSDVGQVRDTNEDSACARAEHGLVVVADGMGGHSAGDVASGIAVEIFCEVVLDAKRDGSAPSVEILEEAVLSANREIARDVREHPERAGMGTTLTGLLLADDSYWIGHVGDSRAWLVRDGAAQQLTEDHTLVEEMVRDGKIDGDDARRHPMRHVLSRCLGAGGEPAVDVLRGRLRDGDVFVLATDGLVPVFDNGRIASVVLDARDADSGSRELVRIGCEEYGGDNVTAVVVKVTADAGGPEAGSDAGSDA